MRGCGPAWLVIAPLLVMAACKSNTTSIAAPVEVVIGSGDGQFAVIGNELTTPLRAVVRSTITGLPRKGISVLWDVTAGGATLVGPTTVVTDSTGSVEVRVRLGFSPGAATIRARVAEQLSAAVDFSAFGVNRPTLSQVSQPTTTAGDTVTLTGTGFSPVADQNVVLFSGVRGRVVAATLTSLDVVVPACLPARGLEVHTQLGVVASADTLAMTLTGGQDTTDLVVGAVVDVADDGGFECHALAGGAGVSYLALVYSSSTVGAAQHPFQLTALGSTGPLPAPARAPAAAAVPTGEAGDPQIAWDERLRRLEAQAVRAGTGRGAPQASGPALATPVVGERRTFSVLNAQNGFDQVVAFARVVGTQAAIFVDSLAPAGGFTDQELDQFVGRFDQVIHPRVTATFGAASDLDQNGRVVILFTPAVNRLTPPASSGFIGGFFYGIDLLPSSTGSNGGEVFYALVPDPTGIYGNVRQKSLVSSVVPGILAHESQHMVHFNERILRLGATAQEALWLSEALAQMAEEIVARAYADLGDTASVGLFRSGTVQRARRYLQGPDTVSMIVTTGQGTLAERGGGFLNLLYVEDQFGGNILERMTQTTRTGVANLEAETGKEWNLVLADWWSATWLDQPGPGGGPLRYPTVDLRGFLGNPYPLVPTPIGATSVMDSGVLWSSSAGYYLVTPGSGATTTLRLGGAAGGPSTAQAALRLRIIRVS